MSDKIEKKESGDYEYSAVPMNQRRSFVTTTIIWTGFVFVITSMMAGGGLAAGLSFGDIVTATVAGNVFLTVIAVFISIIACKTGLTFALLSRYTFGLKGSKVASLFVPIVNIGWYTIQSAVYGHFIALIFHCENTVWEYVLMMVSCFVMGAFAYIGVNALSILGYIAIPAIIYLSVISAFKATTMAGGFQTILSYVPAAPISLTSGITVVIGTWVLTCATSIADIMRYSKSVKSAVLSTATGLIIGNTLMIISAAVSAIALNESDLPTLLLGMGLVIPSIILMTTNLFTTNAANLYSISLNLSNAFNKDRTKMISAVLVISALLTLIKPNEMGVLFTLLEGAGMVIPPLAGILFADYNLVHKGNYEALDTASLPHWKWAAWVTWAAASLLVYKVPFGLPSVNGILFAVVLYPVMNKVLDFKHVSIAAGQKEV